LPAGTTSRNSENVFAFVAAELLIRFFGDYRGAMENGVDTVLSGDTTGTAPLDLAFGTSGPACPGEGRRRNDFEGRFPERPFINLSSTTALIRHLFALNAVIAAIGINKIHIDLFSPEQKVGGSNPLGRTSFL
jgi:hypothetical protein